MAHLTPADADRIIQANLETAGPTTNALMGAWRGMVFQMLERIDLGDHRPAVIATARDIVELWSRLQMAETYAADHEFWYTFEEIPQVRSMFLELNRLALEVVLRHPELPPRPDTDGKKAVEHLDEISQYVRVRLEQLKDLEQHGETIYVTAWELGEVISRCITLMAIILGPTHTQAFKEQYDTCIKSWDNAVKLVGPVKGSIH